jgi:hypothetical protein
MAAKYGERFDARVSLLSEQATRWMSRRAALRGAVLGTVVGVGAVAMGKVPAFAAPPTCHAGGPYDCGPTYRCDHWGDSCGIHGCPTNRSYRLCKSSGPCGPNGTHNTQNEPCVYASGYWVACTGGNCGRNSSRLCLDCYVPGDCRHWCTCISPCT